MVTTINLNTNVPPNRKVRITLPHSVPPGPAEIVVVVASPATPCLHTLRDLARSGFVGLWRDRTDISDTAACAKALRAKAWSRER